MNSQLIDILNPDNETFKNIWPGFKYRSEQNIMASLVKDAVENEKILLVEAGTGTGKTIAYLLPLMDRIFETGNRAVISTETRSLQKQLIHKDIPFLKNNLKINIRVEACYGSANYVCRRKYENVLRTGDIPHKMELHLESFKSWISGSSTGCRFDYTGYVDDEFWTNISRDSELCFGRKCNLFDESFYFNARERWENSKLLVVNHSLLSQNIKADGKLLPDFDYLIIDEAHKFPEIFLSSLTEKLQLSDCLTLSGSNKKSKSRIERIIQNVSTELSKKLSIESGKSKRVDKNFSLDYSDELSSILLESKKECELTLSELKNSLFSDAPREDYLTPEEKEFSLKIENRSKNIEDALNIIKNFFDSHDENKVYWIEKTASEYAEDYTFCISPIDPGPYIKSSLIDRYKSTTFTSATLCADNKLPFSFFRNEIGLNQDSGNKIVNCKQLNSPFDYKKCSILYLPKNISDPAKYEIDFHRQCADEIFELIKITNGGALILFTSKRSLNEIEKILASKKEQLHNISFINQLKLGPVASFKKFMDSENSILLGLGSFWQGIDVPGEKLRLVILVRLPFQVPDMPILEARMEIENQSGKNPFYTVQLPRTILLLRQGFGRLIRTETDRGIIAIFDPRIQNKGYGQKILNSLPPAKVVQSREELRDAYIKLMSPDYKL